MIRNRGYTLIELMLTIALLAIIATLAIPPMADFINRYRSEAQGRQLFELLALSRSKAYSLGRFYTLCASDNGEECTTDWAQGVLLFEDSNGNGSRETGEPIERILPPLPENASLEWNSLSGYLRFRPSGRTRWQLGNFAYCPPDRDPQYGWIIVLNATGRPYFGRDSDGDGIVENGSRVNLSCAQAE